MNRKRMKIICCCTLAVVTFLFTTAMGSGQHSASKTESGYSPEDCIECHRTGSDESERQISISEYEESVHGQEITCLDCHTEVVDDEHQATEGSGTVDCSACHEQENRHGVNGPEEDRPQCHDCHTRHNMLTKTDPASTVHPDQFSATCAGCHAMASGKTDYFSWFPSFQIASHPKADFAGDYSDANCLGCHQGGAAHGEEEPLVDQDCHKCHRSPEMEGAMWGKIHPTADRKKQPAVFAAASIYQVSIVIGVVLLLGRFFRSQARVHSKKNEE